MHFSFCCSSDYFLLRFGVRRRDPLVMECHGDEENCGLPLGWLNDFEIRNNLSLMLENKSYLTEVQAVVSVTVIESYSSSLRSSDRRFVPLRKLEFLAVQMIPGVISGIFLTSCTCLVLNTINGTDSNLNWRHPS